MRYGFAIDHRTLHRLPRLHGRLQGRARRPGRPVPDLGEVRRLGRRSRRARGDFGVMRCNHCTDAPCIQICPTQRAVQARRRHRGLRLATRCIGCKACMQACPYDAIYIDKPTNTAAKCNFCAHRVDNGLEPACVTVCPTHSIWVGDLDDPESRHQPADRRQRHRRPCPRAADRSERALRRSVTGRARPARRTGQGRLLCGRSPTTSGC